MSMSEISRSEYLEWCKQRALEYLPGDPLNAFSSMMSDLREHSELRAHAGIQLGVGLMLLPGWIDDAIKVGEFIRGFS